ALRLRRELTPARYLLAACCRKRGDFVGEALLLGEVVRQAPGFAEARYNYGLALQREEKPVEAAEQLRGALRLEPKNARYALALGIALASTDPNEAILALKRAAELEPRGATAHY